MKVLDVRGIVCQLQASHSRYEASETVQALRELAGILAPHDDQTVTSLVKGLKQGRQTVDRRSNRRRTQRGVT